MFKKITVIVCLLSFAPAAVGAQELVALQQVNPYSHVAVNQSPREVDLTVPQRSQATMQVAADDVRQQGQASEERPRKTHTGLTFKEFCEIHFGEYRWIYWAVAGAALIAIHAAAAGDRH